MREIIVFVVISEVFTFSLVTILVLAIITSLVEQWWVRVVEYLLAEGANLLQILQELLHLVVVHSIWIVC